jgi:hypothetical protein
VELDVFLENSFDTLSSSAMRLISCSMLSSDKIDASRQSGSSALGSTTAFSISATSASAASAHCSVGEPPLLVSELREKCASRFSCGCTVSVSPPSRRANEGSRSPRPDTLVLLSVGSTALSLPPGRSQPTTLRLFRESVSHPNGRSLR